MATVYIVSAQRNKGKTTYLKNMVEEDRSSFGGVLSLSNALKTRYYAHDVESGESRLLMSSVSMSQNAEDNVKIGEFGCIQATFDWVCNTVLKSSKPYIVLDEVGRLELRGEGYAPLLEKLLETDKTLYIAVRTQFVADVVSVFKIGDYTEVFADLQNLCCSL